MTVRRVSVYLLFFLFHIIYDRTTTKREIVATVLLSIAVIILFFFFIQRYIFIKSFIDDIFNEKYTYESLTVFVLLECHTSMITVREITNIKSATRSSSRHEKYLCLSN